MEDLEQLYTVLAFDPGGTTGWTVMSIWPEVIGPEPFETWVADQDKRLVLDEHLEVEIEAANGVGAPVWSVSEATSHWEAERDAAKDYRILDNVVFWSAGEFFGREDLQVDEMLGLVEAWPGNAPVIVEGFTLREFRQDEALLSPVRITSMFRYGLRGTGLGVRRGRGAGRQPILQQPSLAMTTITDDRLKDMDGGKFYRATAGKPHARDAVRHCLTFLRREKQARERNSTLEIPALGRGA